MELLDEDWLPKYRTNKEATWIRCELSNNEKVSFHEFDEWLHLKKKCEKDDLFINKMVLQYRSHMEHIDLQDATGLYLIRSVKGKMSGENQHSYTVGVIRDKKVQKQMWLIPELIVDIEYEDEIENCFEEAIIYDQTKENRKEQV
tara:strand:- start:1592 stop:2026 length:435 start_codon:yes stop_codon:yes gene_type:complete